MDEIERPLIVLPAFADQENRELDASIQALMASLKVTSADAAAQSARGAAMVEHLRHVQLELASSQLRRDARVKELATEDHMRRLNAGETVRQPLLHCICTSSQHGRGRGAPCLSDLFRG